MKHAFRALAERAASAVGSPWAFLLAVLVVIVWAISGPIFGFSDTWQLVINTGTTIITFLMIFLVQNAQNRDARAIHLKLDELLRGVEGARTGLVNLEELSDEELDRLQSEFERMRSRRVIPKGHPVPPKGTAKTLGRHASTSRKNETRAGTPVATVTTDEQRRNSNI